MADLLSWGGILKKKDGLLTNPSFLNNLKNAIQTTPRVTNTNPKTTTVYANNNNQGNSTFNSSQNNAFSNAFSAFQTAERLQREAQQRAEEQRRQQMEQQKRQQEENARRLREQQDQQQKQNNLLNSSLRGGNLFNNTIKSSSNRSGLLNTLSTQNNLERRLNPEKTESDRNYDKWLSTTSMDDLSKEMDKAKADNNIDWIRRIQQYSGKTSNDFDAYKKQTGMQNSELNLGRSAATTLRDINDTKTYDDIDVNDSDNVRYFGRQNLLRKTFKPTLGDNADVSKMSYQDVINTYNNASGDQQADIKKAIADEIVTQREYAKKGNQESLKSINYLADLNALLNEYGTDKGKSFGKQLGDWLSTGGFVGNIGGNALTEALGNITGTEDDTKAYLEKQQNTRADLGAVGAADAALTGIANTALNLGTGGWYGIANAGVNTANTIAGLDDKVLDFDEYGQSSLRNKEQGEQLSELGSTAINDLFAVAGKAGIGPGLGSGSLKDIAKYAWQEPLWAGGTTLAQEGFSNLGKGKDFGDYNWENLGKSFAANLGQDIGMDLFNLGRTRAQMKINSQGENGYLQKGLQQNNDNVRKLEDGTMVKVGTNGEVSRLTDSELAKAITDETSGRKTIPRMNSNVDNNMDGILNNRSVDNNMDGVISRKTRKITDGMDALGRMLTGQNRLQSAFAGAGAEYDGASKNNPTDSTRSNMTIKPNAAPDGGPLVVGDNEAPTSTKKASSYAREKVRRLQGKDVEFGDTGIKSTINAVTRKKLGGRNGNSSDAEYLAKTGMAGNIDELAQTARNVRLDYNRKPTEKPNVDGYMYGDSFYQDKNGNLYKPTVGAEIRGDDLKLYDLTNTKKLRGEATESLKPGDQILDDHVAKVNKSISQKVQNVQNGINGLADLSYDISSKVTNKAKKAAKKAADIANDHPLGGTIKSVANNEAESAKDSTYNQRVNNLEETISGGAKELAAAKKAGKNERATRIEENLANQRQELLKLKVDKIYELNHRVIEHGIPENSPEWKDLTNQCMNILSTISEKDFQTGIKTSEVGSEERRHYNALLDVKKNLTKQQVFADYTKSRSFDNSNTKEVTQKVADTSDRYPLDVDTPGVEGGKTQRSKYLNLSGIEDPNAEALKSGRKMTTNEFFSANKIGSNDLEAMKHNYPKEVQSVKKLIKAGITPETFNSKVLNSDGTVKDAYKYQDIPAMRAMFEMSYNYNKVTDAGSVKDQKKANLFGDEAIKENTMGESSFAKKTSKNKAFSEETRNALASDPIEYKPTTNEERLARANEILSSKSLDEVDTYLRDNYFNTSESNRNSGDTVLAGEFAKMLDANGQYGRATEIVQKMSEIATKQGQQIQALSIISNRTPEGIANMAQTAIQKGGGKVDAELRKQILANTQDIGKIRTKRAELTAENDDISYKIMNGKGDLPALRKRQMEIAQSYRNCLDQEGRAFAKLSETVSNNSPRDKSIFGSVWRAGLLSGPRTHVGNAVSNTFQNALNAGADRIASGLDWARSKITGKEREVVASDQGLRARGQGLKRGLKAAGEVMETGTNLWEGTEKVTSGTATNAWGYGGELEFKNKIADTMVAKPTNYVFRAMSAGDLPFRYSAYENAIRTEAKRQGINQGYKGQALQDYINSRVATPDPDLQAYGINKGNESVYDADTFLSKTMSSLDKQINKIDNKFGRNVAKTAKTLIAPFVKVPSKVLSTAIDYSPVGAVQAVVKKVGGSKNYSTGQFETDIARSGLGTAGFVGLGYALSSAGLLTGGYPDDNDERNRWKAEGIEPNSIKIGDKYVSLNYLGPAAILMGMGAGVQKRQEQGQDPFTVAVGSIGDTFNAFFEQSYVQGLNSAINAVKDSQRYGESYANSLARGLVPNLLRQTAVATDSKQRQVDNPLEAITSGIPGLSQTLDAKVDTYGREIENKQTLPLGQMWDALKISNSRETNAVIDEVSRLHNVDPSNKDLQVTPPTQSGTISVNGVNVKLTDDQKTQLQKDTGAAALAAMQQVMDSSQYQSLSDTEKAAALDKARGEAQKQARKQFIEANNITSENNPETRNTGGQVSGDYASKAISSATSSGTNKNGISINDSLSQASKDILSSYNAMSSDDWNKYLYGDSAKSAAAEYNLAKAKYENDIANGDMSDTQKIKREKELAKLAVSQQWTKNYRDAYGLAGSKTDMQTYLNGLDSDERAHTVAVLNGLNNAMYEAGIITASTYKTRANAINNTKSTTSKKSGSGGRKSSGKSKNGGMSSAEAGALSDLAKTMVKNTNKTSFDNSKPTTNRKMSRSGSKAGKTALATYSTNLAKNATVTKGAKRSIA